MTLFDCTHNMLKDASKRHDPQKIQHPTFFIVYTRIWLIWLVGPLYFLLFDHFDILMILVFGILVQ